MKRYSGKPDLIKREERVLSSAVAPKSITRTAGSSKKNLKFDYDAMGRRIAKHVYTGTTLLRSTYYVLDAQGSSASVSYRQTERHIYGSDRLGIMKADVDLLGSVSMTAVKNTVKHAIGLRSYELKNHLGNVLSVITDRPIPQITNNFFGKLPGSNNQIYTGNMGLGASNSGATLEFWARTTTTATRTMGSHYLITANKGININIVGGKPQVEGRSGTATTRTSGVGTTTMNDGQWHHVAGTFDGAYWKVYLDGILQSSSASFPGNLNSMSFPLRMGTGNIGTYFPGDVKEVSYWDHARTVTQIAADMTTTFSGAETGLKGYWKINEGSGNVATDFVTTSPHNATLSINTYYGNDGTVTRILPISASQAITHHSV